MPTWKTPCFKRRKRGYDMDIMEIWGAYQKDADPEAIFLMYQQCALNATASG